MDIRPATIDDVTLVLPMVRKIAAMHQALDPAKFGLESDPAQRYRPWLIDRVGDPRSVFLVADAGIIPPTLAGFLIATVEREIPIYRIKEFGFIHDLWVEENYRHEGVARQFVSMAVERFAALGARQVRCDTAWANHPARTLFAACGFRPSVVEMLVEVNAVPSPTPDGLPS